MSKLLCATPPLAQAEVLVADIGSTLTKPSAFGGLEHAAGARTGPVPRFLGQGVALTTVAAGNVVLGLDQAREALEAAWGVETSGATLMATSSAAGGLRMTVHGLTQDMTLRSAREASLGARAIVTCTTAGRISGDDLAEMRQGKPNLILLAGGVDYGDWDVVVANAQALTALGLTIPVIYAGNKAVRGEVQRILRTAHVPVFFAVYGAYGHHELVEGRDLTAIRYVIGTRGALTRLGMGREILGHIKAEPSKRKLLPPPAARVLLDQHYIQRTICSSWWTMPVSSSARWGYTCSIFLAAIRAPCL